MYSQTKHHIIIYWDAKHHITHFHKWFKMINESYSQSVFVSRRVCYVWCVSVSWSVSMALHVLSWWVRCSIWFWFWSHPILISFLFFCLFLFISFRHTINTKDNDSFIWCNRNRSSSTRVRHLWTNIYINRGNIESWLYIFVYLYIRNGH